MSSRRKANSNRGKKAAQAKAKSMKSKGLNTSTGRPSGSGSGRSASGYPGFGKMTARDKKMSKVQTKAGHWAVPGTVQHAHGEGWRGWGGGQEWSGGNIGDADSPAAKAYKAEHGESAYKSMVKEKGYKGTGISSKSWRSDRPENEWSTIQNEFYSPLSDFVDKTVTPTLSKYLKDTAVDTLGGIRKALDPWTAAREAQKDFDPNKGRLRNALEGALKDSNIFKPREHQMSIRNQFMQVLGAAPKAVSGFVGLTPNISKIPGVKNLPFAGSINQQDWAHNVTNYMTSEHQGLENVSTLAQLGSAIAGGLGMMKGGLGLMQGGWKNIRGIGQPSGLKNWWNKGRDVRVPNENVASWGKLWGDDLAQIGKFPRDIPFKGIGPTQRVFDKGLLGTGLPKNLRQTGQFVQGKGGLTWSGTRGVPTGPSPAVRQAFERPFRNQFGRTLGQGLQAGKRPLQIGLGAAGVGLGAAGLGIGAGRVTQAAGNTAFNILTSEQGRLRDLMTALDTDTVRNWSQDIMGEGDWNEMQRNWATNLIKHKAQPALRSINDLGGFKGWIAGIQKGKFDKFTGREDVPRTLKNVIGTYSLADKGWNPLSGAYGELRQRFGQLNDFINNRDIEPIRTKLPDQTRREQVRNLRESGYGTGGSNNQMRIQSFDPNKINIQANPYAYEQAAAAESDLTEFWKEQEALNTAADQRLKDIQADQSDYTKLINELNQYQTGYTDELARIQPIGQGIEDELARIQPVGQGIEDELARIQPMGQGYKDELERIKPFAKQYTDEIERLKPFDQMFRDEFRFGIAAGWDRPDRYGVRRSGDSWDKKGNLIAGGISGREFIEQNKRWYSGTKNPYTTQLLKDYEEYLTNVENLHKWQKEHEAHVGKLETEYKDYQDYLGDIQSQQKEYQTYLGDIKGQQTEYQTYLSDIQSEQDELSTYRSQVSKRSKELDDYENIFRSARQASDMAAKAYTIRSQQGISDAFRPGVTGIRAARGYSTYGGSKSKSPKKRFNRDFRIGSFGDEARIQPINI